MKSLAVFLLFLGIPNLFGQSLYEMRFEDEIKEKWDLLKYSNEQFVMNENAYVDTAHAVADEYFRNNCGSGTKFTEMSQSARVYALGQSRYGLKLEGAKDYKFSYYLIEKNYFVNDSVWAILEVIIDSNFQVVQGSEVFEKKGCGLFTGLKSWRELQPILENNNPEVLKKVEHVYLNYNEKKDRLVYHVYTDRKSKQIKGGYHKISHKLYIIDAVTGELFSKEKTFYKVRVPF